MTMLQYKNIAETVHPELQESSAISEFEAFQSTFDSLGSGIGLISRQYTLLYSNATFEHLLHSNKSSLVGKKVYLNKGLKFPQLQKIEQSLNNTGQWEGVFPKLGKGLKVTITKINDRSSTLFRYLDDAYYMLVLTDHSEVLALQEELNKSKLLIEKMEKGKSEFISQISHELRTPLNAILGFTQLLKIEPELSDEQQDNLEEIASASDHLLNLINKILDVSKVEHNGLNIYNEKINLTDIIIESISLIKPLAQKGNINVRHSKSKSCLVNDRVRLKQVIINILSNAIKYNVEGGEVLIQAFTNADSSVCIEIQDSGKGIPEKLLHTIFNPFERLGLTNSQIEGTGIGLMISRRLVNIMGGSINVVSEPARGSVFSINFPAPLTPLEEDQQYLAKKPQKVLWAGADGSTVNYLKRLCKLRQSLEFHQVKSITQALELKAELAPDLIFLNIRDSFAESEGIPKEIQKLLKIIPTIAVIDLKLFSLEQLAMMSDFKAILPVTLNTIDFMRIIDHQLFRN